MPKKTKSKSATAGGRFKKVFAPKSGAISVPRVQ